MKNLLIATVIMTTIFMGCKSKNPTVADPCDYDGYRNISFTSNGQIITDQMYDKSNTMYMYYTFNYKYNDYIESIVVHNPSGTNNGYIVCSLNASGNSDVDSYLDQDSILLGYETYTYNASANAVSSAYYDADSVLISTYSYTYDAGLRLSVTEKYDAQNTLVEKTTNTRNSDGSVARATTTDKNGTKTGYRVYAYNNQNMTIKITYYDCTGGMAKGMFPTGFRNDHFRIVRGKLVAL